MLKLKTIAGAILLASTTMLFANSYAEENLEKLKIAYERTFRYTSELHNEMLDGVEVKKTGVHKGLDVISVEYKLKKGLFYPKTNVFKIGDLMFNDGVDLGNKEVKSLSELYGAKEVITTYKDIIKSKQDRVITLFEEKAKNGELLIFVDPFCKYCHELFKDPNSLEDMKSKKLNIVLLPILGKDSEKKSAFIINKIKKDKSLSDDDKFASLVSNLTDDRKIKDENIEMKDLIEAISLDMVQWELLKIQGTPTTIKLK